MKHSLEERKQRLSLTLVFAGLVFAFLFVAMLLIVVAILILIRVGDLRTGESSMHPEGLVVIIALISVVAGTVLAATAGRYPLRPINGIINAMNRLAAGDFRTRLSYPRRIGRLPVVREFADSFNTMASELENTEMLRKDFIDNFSHEFKTPIVSIAGFAKLLKKGNLPPEEQKEYLDIIENESLRLSAMATNVLNMTRVENQTILTDVTEYNLSEQLRNCVLLLESKWSRKHLELNLDFDEHRICANEELMKQVWVNLLDNAVKFTPEGGSVGLAIDEDSEGISVSVSNAGSEIPEESRKRIFQKFYQADESHATEGSGIGLAIVHKVVTLHGGKVEVCSRNGRTVFTVQLPRLMIGEAVV